VQCSRYAAITGIMRRDYPRFRSSTGIGDGADDVTRAIDAIGRLDCSHILIQGPPGAGKTHTSAHAIVHLLARRKRIGVSAHSHKAINNLLQAVETAATDRGLRFRDIKKSSYEEQFLNGSIIEDTTKKSEAVEGGHDLIAGTAWLFAREELDQQLDYLFIDEAGQVSLANTIGMGVSAKNVILVGERPNVPSAGVARRGAVPATELTTPPGQIERPISSTRRLRTMRSSLSIGSAMDREARAA
jgi:AAA domain